MTLAPGHGKEKKDKVPDLIDLTLKKKKSVKFNFFFKF